MNRQSLWFVFLGGTLAAAGLIASCDGRGVSSAQRAEDAQSNPLQTAPPDAGVPRPGPPLDGGGAPNPPPGTRPMGE